MSFGGCINDTTGMGDCTDGRTAPNLVIKPSTTDNTIKLFMTDKNDVPYNEEMSIPFRLILGMNSGLFQMACNGR